MRIFPYFPLKICLDRQKHRPYTPSRQKQYLINLYLCDALCGNRVRRYQYETSRRIVPLEAIYSYEVAVSSFSKRRTIMKNIKGKRQKLIPKSILFLTLLCALLLGSPLLSAAAQGSYGYHGATQELVWRGTRLSCSATACSSPTGRGIRYMRRNLYIRNPTGRTSLCR